ncbi:hypothetical protein V6N13_147995 [Hibiscus sabdariffa]
MERNKFALLLVAMAVVLLVTVAPTVKAARYKDVPFTIITDEDIRKPDENCVGTGGLCGPFADQCCTGRCVPISGPMGVCVSRVLVPTRI